MEHLEWDHEVHTLKPVIKELIRTQVCLADIKLLVQKIYVVNFSSAKAGRGQAYRIYLSDGEKAIQAILRAEIHPFITTGDIAEDSYVVLTKYELAKGRRIARHGEVLYLLVANLHPVGHQPRDQEGHTSEIFYPETNDSYDHLTLESEDEEANPAGYDETQVDDRPLSQKYLSEDDAVCLVVEHERQGSNNKRCGVDGHDRTKAGGTASRSLQNLSPNIIRSQLGTQPESGTSRIQATENLLQEHSIPLDFKEPQGSNGPSENLHGSRFPDEQDRSNLSALAINQTSQEEVTRNAKTKDTSPGCSISTVKQYPTPDHVAGPLLAIGQPLRITPMCQITGSGASQNKVYDVFAVICSINDKVIKRIGIDAHRDIRIMDTSTTKKVSLSVFVEPDRFTPAVGTVALFRRVTTHKWDGGSLNAYANRCKGRKWFIPNPINVEGCDCNALRELWRTMQAEEAEKQKQEEEIKTFMQRVSQDINKAY